MSYVHYPSRRKSPLWATALAVGLGLVATSLFNSPRGAWAQGVDLRPQLHSDVRRVTVEWELSGELKLPTSPDAPEADTSPKVGATAKLSYDQAPLLQGAGHQKSGRERAKQEAKQDTQTLPDHAPSEPDTQPLSAQPLSGRFARLYHSVEATVGVGTNVRRHSLREDRRLTLTSLTSDGPRIMAVDGPLRREELDTLKLPADSLSLDALLPPEPVEPGGSWSHGPEVMAPLAMLQAVEVCECQSLLVEANSRYAKCQMAGSVHGMIDGTRTEMELDGVYLVDLERGEITQFNLAVREKREVGPITPGLEGVMKLRIKVAEPTDARLTQKLIARVATSYPVPATAVETYSPELGFVAVHDASWHPTGTRGHTMSLRKVGPSGLVAHTTLTRLPPKRLIPEVSLAQFRADVARTIGKPMAGIASDEQYTNQHGCRVLRVVAQGSVAGVPVEWHAYQVAPPEDQPEGHRLALTFVVEADKLEELAGQDRQLVERIELLAEPVETAADGARPLK